MRRVHKSTWALIRVGILCIGCIGGIVWWWLTYQDRSFIIRFRMEHSDLRRGHFKDVMVESVHLDNKQCASVVFDHCGFIYTRFNGTDFSRSQMTDTSFYDTTVQDCNFEHANLRRSNWLNSQWEGCDLGFADLREVDANGVAIIGCDLHAAKLDGISLQNCTYDRTTKWPPNFKPTDYGAVLAPDLH